MKHTECSHCAISLTNDIGAATALLNELLVDEDTCFIGDLTRETADAIVLVLDSLGYKASVSVDTMHNKLTCDNSDHCCVRFERKAAT